MNEPNSWGAQPLPSGAPGMPDPANPPYWPPPVGPPVVAAKPPFYPDGSPAELDDNRRWGMGDILLGLPFIVVGAVLGVIVGILASGNFDLDSLENSPAVIACGALGQQAAMAAWPLIVARWKGNGAVKDFGFRFSLSDLLWGPIYAAAMTAAAFATSVGVAIALGVSESEDLSNTDILTDNRGSAWFVVIVLVTVIGAPFSEELYFRGLTMRSIEKRFGLSAGIVLSSIIFVLPHFTGVAWRETVVLFVTLGVVALCLALMVWRTGRLGTSIVAHSIFNSIAVLLLILST